MASAVRSAPGTLTGTTVPSSTHCSANFSCTVKCLFCLVNFVSEQARSMNAALLSIFSVILP